MKIWFDYQTEGCVQDLVRAVSWEWQEGVIYMELPEDFQEMPKERREEYYPYENRPETILENRGGTVQFTLQFPGQEMKVEETRTAAEKVHELTEDAFPKYEMSPEYLYEEGQVPVGWFTVRMEDRESEHIKAVFSARGKMVLLTMTYPENETMKWRPVSRCIFASIREKEG